MKGPVLTALARASIAEAFGGPAPVKPANAPWLDERRAVFVTLKMHGELRGCIGQLEARMSLFDAVRTAAKHAAFEDPRFPPLVAQELPDVHIEVSVLSPLEPVPGIETEADALAALRPGVDGIVLRSGFHSGVFIPEVWKELPGRHEFLQHLKRKAGLPLHEWRPGTTLERFTAELFEEP